MILKTITHQPTKCLLSWFPREEISFEIQSYAASCSTVQSSVKQPCPNYMLCLHLLVLPFLTSFFSLQKNSFTDNWKQTYKTCNMLLYKWNLNSHAFVFSFFYSHLLCKIFSKYIPTFSFPLRQLLLAFW